MQKTLGNAGLIALICLGVLALLNPEIVTVFSFAVLFAAIGLIDILGRFYAALHRRFRTRRR